MEKKIWTRPVAEVEQFMANEYIAKCADVHNKYFSFTCDAGAGKSGDVWKGGTVTGNTISGGELLTEDDWFIVTLPGSYSSCGATHYVAEAEKDKVFFDGFYNASGYDDSTTGDFVPVVIWTDGGTNVHCTTALMEDIKTVQGNKS